jgi:hypothetical protein
METGATAMTHDASVPRRPGFFARVLYWILDLDEPGVIEERIRQRRGAPGYFASLPPEALAYIRNYDGPENLGPPLTRRERRNLERRRASWA